MSATTSAPPLDVTEEVVLVKQSGRCGRAASTWVVEVVYVWAYLLMAA